MSRVIQIVPALNASVNGIADYAAVLGKTLLDEHRVESIYLMISQHYEHRREFLHAIAVQPDNPGRILSQLRMAASATTPVLVHYCGYGFHKRGVPMALVRALANYRRNSAGPLAIMFHELYAPAKLFSTSLILSPLQKYLARALAHLSDVNLTNCAIQANEIRRWTNKAVYTFPVPSNMGEITNPLPLSCRRPVAIVFGQLGRRQKIYSAISKANPILDGLGINEILDIGPGDPIVPAQPRRVTRLGVLRPELVSQHMRDSRVGLVAYSPHCLARSGIFAAYAAHGLLTFVNPLESTSYMTVLPGTHFVTTRDCPVALIRTQQIADTLFQWYRQHNISAQAAAQLKILFDVM